MGRSQVGLDAAAVSAKWRPWGRWARHLLLLPNVVLVVLFFAVPLGIVAVYSLGQVNVATFDIEFGWTTSNYSRIGESIYFSTLLRSLLLSLVCTVSTVIVGFPLAYFISRQSQGWQNVLLLFVIVPFWTSFVVRTYAWTNLLQSGGPVDDLARNAGLGTPNLLYTPEAVGIGILYTYLPLMVLPIYVSLVRIDREILDAAADLGARGARLFRRVILPLSLPGVVGGAVLVGISSTGEYIIPEILGGSKTLMLGNVVANQFGETGDYPFGSAIAMSLMALMLVMLIGLRWASRVEASS